MSLLEDLKQLVNTLAPQFKTLINQLEEKDELLKNLQEDLNELNTEEGSTANTDKIAAQEIIEKMQFISKTAQSMLEIEPPSLWNPAKPIKETIQVLKKLTFFLETKPEIKGINSFFAANLYSSYLEAFSELRLDNIQPKPSVLLSNDDIDAINQFKESVANAKNQITDLNKQKEEYTNTLRHLSSTTPIVEPTTMIEDDFEEQNLSRFSIAERVQNNPIVVTNAALIDDDRFLEALDENIPNDDQRLHATYDALRDIEAEQKNLAEQRALLLQEKAILDDPINLSAKAIEIEKRKNQLAVFFRLTSNFSQNQDDNLLDMLNYITGHNENSLQALMNTENFKYFSDSFKTAIQSPSSQSATDYLETCLQEEAQQFALTETAHLKEKIQKQQSLEKAIQETVHTENINNYRINTLLNKIKILTPVSVSRQISQKQELDELFFKSQAINQHLLETSEKETFLEEKKDNLSKIDTLISQMRQPDITNIIEKSKILDKYPELISISAEMPDEKNRIIKTKLDNIVRRGQQELQEELTGFLRKELTRLDSNFSFLSLIDSSKTQEKIGALNQLIEEIDDNVAIDSAFLKRIEEALGQKRKNPFKPESNSLTQGEENFAKFQTNFAEKIKKHESDKKVLDEISHEFEKIGASKEIIKEIDIFEIQQDTLPSKKTAQSIEVTLNSSTSIDNTNAQKIKEQLDFMQNLNEEFTPDNNLSLLNLIHNTKNSELMKETQQFISEFYYEQYNTLHPQSEQKNQRNMDICIKSQIVPQLSDLRDKVDNHIGEIKPDTLDYYAQKEIGGKILAYTNLITEINVFSEDPDNTEATKIAAMLNDYQSLAENSDIPENIAQSMQSLLTETKDYIKENAPKWHQSIQGEEIQSTHMYTPQ